METILFPNDFSACAANALVFADELAQRTRARMVLFHNIYSPQMPDHSPYGGLLNAMPVVNQDYAEEIKKKLKQIKQMLRRQHPHSGVLYESVVRRGNPAETIPQVADEEQADLIVMGTQGARGIEQLLVGSRAAEELEKSRCPVLVVPQKTPYQPFKKIVVATDLEENPLADMDLVIQLARLFDAELSFFHFLEKELVGARAAAWEGFKRIQLKYPYEKVSFYTNTREALDEAIDEFVQVHQANLLVMVNHRRELWNRLVSKSQTQHMAYHTQIPLLALHA